MGDTYVPSALEVKDPKLFASNVRSMMAAHMEVGCTEHSYEDAFLGYESKAHVGLDFELAKLKPLFNCSYEDVKTWLRCFEVLDKKQSGAINYAEFKAAAQAAGLDSSGRRRDHAWLRLFNFFDQDQSGDITFREFVPVAALLSDKGSEASGTELAFLIFDVDGEGKVQKGLLQAASSSYTSIPAGADAWHPHARPPHGFFPSDFDEDGPKIQSFFDAAEAIAGEELSYDEFTEHVKGHPEVRRAALQVAQRFLALRA